MPRKTKPTATVTAPPSAVPSGPLQDGLSVDNKSTPSETNPAVAESRAPAQNVGDTGKEEIIAADASTKPEADVSIKSESVSMVTPETVVTAVHISDTTSVTTTVPVMEVQASGGAKPDAPTKTRTRKPSQPQVRLS